MDLFGAEKICYGTDYPFPLGDLEHGKFIESMQGISEQEKQQVFHKSVLAFLGKEELINPYTGNIPTYDR
jgi:aminocarboxymuconate-semialdehyde decarboxylase